MASRRLDAVVALAVGVLAVAAIAATPAAGADVTVESFYVAVENRLPASGGMGLVCRAVGGAGFLTTEYSVAPRGTVPRGGRRVAELISTPTDAKGRVVKEASVLCSWSYSGNYVANLYLISSKWPEAKRCQDPASDGMCRVVFEDETVRLETPGGGVRVIGDLPVKRCKRDWLLFSTGCSYPDHPHPYAGRRLANAFEFFAV